MASIDLDDARSGAMAAPEEVLVHQTASSATESDLSALLKALQRLDRLLERSVIAAEAAYGPQAAADR